MAVSLEFRETRLRWILTLCVTIAAGAGYAAPLAFGLRTTYEPVTPRAPVRVAFARTPSATGEAKEPAPSARLPLDVPAPQVPKVAETKTPPKPATDTTPTVAETAPVADALPAPPAPPDEYAELQGRAYPEIAGGSVMVMALLLDSAGTVQNARIMVPSNKPAGDLTYLMMLPGTRVPVPEPGIAPGETRWIELRFRYESDAVLP